MLAVAIVIVVISCVLVFDMVATALRTGEDLDSAASMFFLGFVFAQIGYEACGRRQVLRILRTAVKLTGRNDTAEPDAAQDGGSADAPFPPVS